jgi:hypothetical protein
VALLFCLQIEKEKICHPLTRLVFILYKRIIDGAFPALSFLAPWGIYLQTTVMTGRLILQIAQPYPNTTYLHQQQIIILLVLVG